MKNEPDEIHFDCPMCKRPMSGDKALLGEMINCPDCNEAFIPAPRKLEPAPDTAKTEIRLECPKCFHKFKLFGRALANEFVTCPNCGDKFSSFSPNIKMHIGEVQIGVQLPANDKLEKCADCGKEKSTRAFWCPSCGSMGKSFFWKILEIVCIFWLISLIFGVVGLIIWKLFEAAAKIMGVGAN